MEQTGPVWVAPEMLKREDVLQSFLKCAAAMPRVPEIGSGASGLWATNLA